MLATPSRARARLRHAATAAALRVLWRDPSCWDDPHAIERIPSYLTQRGARRPLLLTSAGVTRRGQGAPLLDALRTAGVEAAVLDQAPPEPTVQDVEDALSFYQANGCDSIVALGGGSVLDAAKAVAARAANPSTDLADLCGLGRIRHALPTVVAVPTTAGSGSETTAGAVVIDERALPPRKFVLADLKLVPPLTVLDPRLTLSAPAALTAHAGMDALTHAIEARANRFTTRAARACSREAVALIARHLPAAYADGADLRARAGMQRAAYLAGRAITTSYVGTVHAIAHAAGPLLGLPHGLVNAIVLPTVLRAFGPAASEALADLARAAGLPAQTSAHGADELIRWIEGLNARMGIPRHLPGLTTAHLPLIRARALPESWSYPVPSLWTEPQMTQVLERLVPPAGENGAVG
ncbi:iron-containing alcohol dehydrogenase [Eggerthellaceae bacterium zg-1084]|uniref:iron-containing alcohol dehydrogenase n=1 Tax=Berryella wangjianweii TaxID=2734634 RepID=UPI001554A31B|nr:iron-containing alcohol dehydrogenase [Berryella wangjianweii]NPD31387.1 iron-containing alcohol dehydrogenase [Berryella wangjianweii]